MNFEALVNSVLMEQTVLVEQIYGNMAAVYHRKSTPPEESQMFVKGVRSGPLEDTPQEEIERSRFGTGLYACYDFNQQLNPKMAEKYGKYVVKGKVDLSDYFFIDPVAFQQARPGENFADHLKTLKKESPAARKYSTYDIWNYAREKSSKNINLATYIKQAERGTMKENNVLEQEIVSELVWRQVKSQGFKGLIMRNRQDGRVAVIYDRFTFLPFLYAVVDEPEIKRLLEFPPEQREKQVQWSKRNPDIKNIKRPNDPEYDVDFQKQNASNLRNLNATKQQEVDYLLLDYMRPINWTQRGGRRIAPVEANFPYIKLCRRDIKAEDVKIIKLPNLEEAGSISLQSPEVFDLRSLKTIRKSFYIMTDDDISLPKLETVGDVKLYGQNSDIMKTVSFPQLRQCGNANIPRAKTINVPNLVKAEVLEARDCLSLTISKAFKGKLKVSRKCVVNKV